MNCLASKCLYLLDDLLGSCLHKRLFVFERLGDEGEGVVEDDQVALTQLGKHVLYHLEGGETNLPWVLSSCLHENSIVEADRQVVIVDTLHHLENQGLDTLLQEGIE